MHFHKNKTYLPILCILLVKVPSTSWIKLIGIYIYTTDHCSDIFVVENLY